MHCTAQKNISISTESASGQCYPREKPVNFLSSLHLISTNKWLLWRILVCSSSLLFWQGPRWVTFIFWLRKRALYLKCPLIFRGETVARDLPLAWKNSYVGISGRGCIIYIKKHLNLLSSSLTETSKKLKKKKLREWGADNSSKLWEARKWGVVKDPKPAVRKAENQPDLHCRISDSWELVAAANPWMWEWVGRG